MTWWPFWLSAIALAAVPMLHWFGLGRALAVSGRYTALVNRLRQGPAEQAPALSEAELLAAIRAETSAAFGEGALQGEGVAAAELASEPVRLRRPEGSLRHVLFLLGLLLGGALSAVLGGVTPVGLSLSAAGFAARFGEGGPLPALVLLLGGTLVGFGTRMAGGCTSGHGLCGVSQLQPGSLLATAAFFGAGIATSWLLEVWP